MKPTCTTEDWFTLSLAALGMLALFPVWFLTASVEIWEVCG